MVLPIMIVTAPTIRAAIQLLGQPGTGAVIVRPRYSHAPSLKDDMAEQLAATHIFTSQAPNNGPWRIQDGSDAARWHAVAASDTFTGDIAGTALILQAALQSAGPYRMANMVWQPACVATAPHCNANALRGYVIHSGERLLATVADDLDIAALNMRANLPSHAGARMDTADFIARYEAQAERIRPGDIVLVLGNHAAALNAADPVAMVDAPDKPASYACVICCWRPDF
jgi:hypothetical protein